MLNTGCVKWLASVILMPQNLMLLGYATQTLERTLTQTQGRIMARANRAAAQGTDIFGAPKR